MLDRAGHGLLATAQAALAPAEDALVGLDLDEHLVACSDPHRIGLDRGDLKLRRHPRPRSTRIRLSQSALRAISVSPSNRCIRSWSNSSQICSSGATAMVGGTLTLTMAAGQERLHEGDVSGRLHRVGLGRDAARHRALVQPDRRVACAEHDLPGRRPLRPCGRCAARARGSSPPRCVSTVSPSAVDASSGMRLIAGLPTKLGDEHVHRMGEDLRRRIVLLQEAAVHHRHLVGHGHGLELVVRHVDDRRLEVLMEALDLGAHLHAQLGVEIGERLVHQEHRAGRARARGRAPRAAAGRRRARAACARAGASMSSTLRRLPDLLVDLVLGQLAHLQREGEVLVDRSSADRARSSGTPSRCRDPWDRDR